MKKRRSTKPRDSSLSRSSKEPSKSAKTSFEAPAKPCKKSGQKKTSRKSLASTKVEEPLTIFQCAHCGATLISSDLLDKPHTVLNQNIGVRSECKPHPFIETISFHYQEDETYHVFSTLIPNVLHSADLAKPDSDGIYHLLRCQGCTELIGKHFIFSTTNKKFEGKHCFPKTSLKVTNEGVQSIEEIKEQIVQIRERRIEIDAKILKMMKKVLRRMGSAKLLIQGYEDKYKCIIKDINYLKDTVLSIDITDHP